MPKLGITCPHFFDAGGDVFPEGFGGEHLDAVSPGEDLLIEFPGVDADEQGEDGIAVTGFFFLLGGVERCRAEVIGFLPIGLQQNSFRRR